MTRSRTITIKDVAREADVSVATVSRALNGHDNVAEPVRKLVLETASRLRYQPHAAARSLSSRRTQTVGVVLPDLYGEFFSELIRGIDQVARAHRQHLLVSSYHGHPEEQGAALRAMRGRVDGLLVLSPYADRPGFLTDNLPDSLPAVLINTQLPESGYPTLSIDNYRGATAMVEHLVESGHKRIAFIGGPADNFDARERARGYRDALARLLPKQSPWELPGDFDEASGYEAGRKVLEAEVRPDAVFAANDMMALGCLYAFNQAGVRVPEDIALAGFDDIPLARFVHPPLTTMRVNIAELGGMAMGRLLQAIESGPDAAAPQLLTPELIARDSSLGIS
ncbi:LacI family DNA-binding transcriptional regulator [Pseudoxanthomonas helianthi]|uniref:LacI family DNA-binding transcriptional regulator n=1 Tax=Pseudoxanthomonas helianthi TaxID=1453541 RepID=A0A940X660_9GAMM|nr:LacI family DNA-binding transcriptional regulator [Pseudoxanthomonas helianthi]MBP3985069.1 LacI family DNA-binding transcriptional regulator [Pseudoxanthomonas helianthi]